MRSEILNIFGDDLMVVNAARVSFGKAKDQFEPKDARLIQYLAEHKHTSPFRHPQIQYRIECPIYVERQLFKHQIGLTANSISGRYVDFSDTYTLINIWREQSKDSKQGSAGNLLPHHQHEARLMELHVIKTCKEAYDKLIELGVSKEQARSVLPLSLNTTFIWTGSLLAFIHLFKLRTKADAQGETRDLAHMMLNQLQYTGKFVHSLQAFGL